MKLSLKRIFLLLFLMAVAAFFISSFAVLNRPSKSLTKTEEQQALENILGREVNTEVTPVPLGDTLHQGKYVSFLYPKAAKQFIALDNGQPVKFNDLEHFSFDISDSNLHFFSQVLVYPSIQSVSDYSGVRLRQSEPDTYTQSLVTSSDKQNGLAFANYDSQAGYQMTGFFLVNGKIYTFSIQGPDQQAVKNLFEEIIPTVKFLD
jgi:hypothetical protein